MRDGADDAQKVRAGGFFRLLGCAEIRYRLWESLCISAGLRLADGAFRGDVPPDASGKRQYYIYFIIYIFYHIAEINAIEIGFFVNLFRLGASAGVHPEGIVRQTDMSVRAARQMRLCREFFRRRRSLLDRKEFDRLMSVLREGGGELTANCLPARRRATRRCVRAHGCILAVLHRAARRTRRRGGARGCPAPALRRCL